MATARETVVSGRSAGSFAEGEEVTWRAWHFGIPWRMTSRITQVQRPHRFVDHQVAGPFATFHHEHVFEEYEGQTIMSDVVSFQAPFGPLGRLVEVWGLGRYMEHLIKQRNQYLVQRLEHVN